LGEINIKVYDRDNIEGKDIYKSIAYIDSYEGLPFVNLHQVYESWFDSSLYPVFFQALKFNENDTSYTKYYFKQGEQVHVLRGKLNTTKHSIDTVVYLNDKYLDGLSLLYFVRFNFKENDSTSASCFVNEDTATTFVNYYDDKTAVSLDVLEYDIECFRIDGETNFTGIFGLTGYYEGWFSNDVYRIPIAAELQVIIGKISIELMDWKKEIWQPPKYKDG
jgi:hypothetical protein